MKNNALTTFLKQTEGLEMISDKFHNITKNKKILAGKPIEKIPASWVKIHFKTYPRLKNKKIPINIMPSSIKNLFINHHSERNFLNNEIDIKDLFTVLFFSAGITKPSTDLNESRRPYPSAGARYPLEVYILALKVKDLSAGLYHYNVKQNLLEILLEKDLHEQYESILGHDENLANASFAIIITGVLNRTRIKYGDRGYRYILLEAGHLAQNIMLLSSFMHIKTCPIGGFIDDKVNTLLDISKQKEQALYLIVGGI